MPIERVTKELLERELNSDRFISGLERVIYLAQYSRPIVNGARLEVRFDVDKQLFGEGINYPSEIAIGREGSVGYDIAQDFAEELYVKHTGKDPQADDNIEDFAIFCEEHRLCSVSYPKVEGMFGFDFVDPSYALFHLHSHPKGGPQPSFGDGKVMSWLRGQTKKYGFHARPISMIVSGAKYDSKIGIFPILFFQEKGDLLLTEEETQEAVRYARRFAGKNEREHPGRLTPQDEFARLVIKTLSKGALDGKERKEYRPLYNCGLAYFTPGDTRMDFDFDVGMFAYKSEAREVAEGRR